MLFNRLKHRKQDSLPPNPILGPLNLDLAGSEMPESLDPKLEPKRTAVFDDEVDPAWRDPDTTK
jgi:hypothetical protein